MGVHYWPNGQIYAGEYQNGKKHGYGIHKFSNETVYSGNFYNGKQHSLGVFVDNVKNHFG